MSPFGALVELVLPTPCVGCGRSAGPLCDGCLPAARPFPVGCAPACWAAGAYAGALRAAVLAYKERRHRALAGRLGVLLAAAAGRAAGDRPGVVVLVPVPSAPAVVRVRGHDHVRRLAVAAARELGRDGSTVRVAPLLRVTRRPADSLGLSAEQRRVNLAGAFGMRPQPGVTVRSGRGAAARSAGDAAVRLAGDAAVRLVRDDAARAGPDVTVVLVDDVVTTGATLAEAARALAAAGLVAGGAAVVAATPRRR